MPDNPLSILDFSEDFNVTQGEAGHYVVSLNGELGGGADSEWEEIATYTVTTPVFEHIFTDLPTTYDDLRVVATGVTHNGGSAASIALFIGDAGGFSVASASLTGSIAVGATANGVAYVRDYTKPQGLVESAATASTSAPNLSSQATLAHNGFITQNGITRLRIAPANSGPSITAGTFKLYGRKYRVGSGSGGTGNGVIEINGDSYLPVNASWNGTNWIRTDVTKPAWLWQYNVTNNMIYEGYKGLTLWVAQPGANPITGFTTAGGWAMVHSSSQFKDFTIGGNGIEIDGNVTLPYGRVQHALISGIKTTGILTNVYLDNSGRDDTTKPSFFAGFTDDGAGNEFFRVRRSEPGEFLVWEDLFAVDKDGTMTGPGAAFGAITATWGSLRTQGWNGDNNQGVLYFGNSGNAYCYFDGASYAFPAYPITNQGHAVETVNHKGVANGYASLGADGKVPAEQLPAASGGSPTASQVQYTPDFNGWTTAQNVQDALHDIDLMVVDLNNEKQATSQKGQPLGYASLDADGKVPAEQLPASSGSGAAAATFFEVRQGTVADKYVSPQTLYSADNVTTPASSTAAGVQTVNLNLTTATNVRIGITADSLVLNLPDAGLPPNGKSGLIIIQQPASGAKPITWDAKFLFTHPAHFSTAPSSIDVVHYYANSFGINCTLLTEGANVWRNKGVANGYASLDAEGKVPAEQLPDGLSAEWVEIGSHTFAAGSTQHEFLNISQDYDDLVIVASGFSFTGTTTLSVALSSDGTTFYGGAVLSNTGTANIAGKLYIRDYANPALNIYRTENVSSTTNGTPGTTTGNQLGFTLPGTVKAARIFMGTGGNTISSGTVKLYARKNAGSLTQVKPEWEQIGATQTVSSAVAQVLFNNIPSTYDDLLLVFDGASHDYTTTSANIIAMPSSDNGSTFPAIGANLSSVAIANTATMSGVMHIRGYSDPLTSKYMHFESNAYHSTDVTPPVSIRQSNSIIALPGVLNAIKIVGGGNPGSNLDAGTYRLFGRKNGALAPSAAVGRVIDMGEDFIVYQSPTNPNLRVMEQWGFSGAADGTTVSFARPFKTGTMPSVSVTPDGDLPATSSLEFNTGGITPSGFKIIKRYINWASGGTAFASAGQATQSFSWRAIGVAP